MASAPLSSTRCAKPATGSPSASKCQCGGAPAWGLKPFGAQLSGTEAVQADKINPETLWAMFNGHRVLSAEQQLDAILEICTPSLSDARVRMADLQNACQLLRAWDRMAYSVQSRLPGVRAAVVVNGERQELVHRLRSEPAAAHRCRAAHARQRGADPENRPASFQALACSHAALTARFPREDRAAARAGAMNSG